MKVLLSYGVFCALTGALGGCSAIKGVAGDMGAPVDSMDRAGELAEVEAAKNKKLDAGTFVFATSAGGDAKTSFKLGESIVGTLAATASPEEWYQKYTGDLQKAGQGQVLPMLFIDGRKVYDSQKDLNGPEWSTVMPLTLTLWGGSDKEMPLTGFDMHGGYQWSSGQDTLEERFYHEVADKLPNGSHDVRFELHIYRGMNEGKPPFAAGEFTLVVDDAGRKALASQSRRVPPPAQRGFTTEDKAIRQLANDMEKESGARIFLARSASVWVIERDAFQQPIKRYLRANFVFEHDGACRWRREAQLCEDHMGGGRYGAPYYCSDYDFFKGKPGNGVYTLPCAAARKMK